MYAATPRRRHPSGYAGRVLRTRTDTEKARSQGSGGIIGTRMGVTYRDVRDAERERPPPPHPAHAPRPPAARSHSAPSPTTIFRAETGRRRPLAEEGDEDPRAGVAETPPLRPQLAVLRPVKRQAIGLTQGTSGAPTSAPRDEPSLAIRTPPPGEQFGRPPVATRRRPSVRPRRQLVRRRRVSEPVTRQLWSLACAPTQELGLSDTPMTGTSHPGPASRPPAEGTMSFTF